MHVHGFCPRCNQEIPSERYVTGFAICECGWFDGAPEQKARSATEKKTITAMVVAAVLFTALYGHMLNWGAYAFEIPFVKIQQLTGTLSKQGYEELADACVHLNKWSCAQDTYMDLYKQTRDPEGLARLAHLQVRLQDRNAALSSYAAYFRAQGRNGEAALEYAKLLEESGNTEMAFQYYEASIQMRPQILPVSATTAIVRLYMKQGRYQEAYDRILAFHSSAGNAKGYLNTELAQLEEYFGAHGGGSKSRKGGNRVARF